jgi:copper(I)-binding protein
MNSKNALLGMVLAVAGLACSLPAAAQVVASEGWARATPPGARTAAAYLVLTNKGTESRSLLKIVSPISDRVTLHQTSVDAQGVSRMWPLAKLEIEPGQSVSFEPGGRHVMFDDIKAPFVAGQKVRLALTFEDEPEQIVELEVRPLVPAAPMQHDHGSMQHDHK